MIQDAKDQLNQCMNTQTQIKTEIKNLTYKVYRFEDEVMMLTSEIKQLEIERTEEIEKERVTSAEISNLQNQINDVQNEIGELKKAEKELADKNVKELQEVVQGLTRSLGAQTARNVEVRGEFNRLGIKIDHNRWVETSLAAAKFKRIRRL